jgi:hypothetical protein
VNSNKILIKVDSDFNFVHFDYLIRQSEEMGGKVKLKSIKSHCFYQFLEILQHVKNKSGRVLIT